MTRAACVSEFFPARQMLVVAPFVTLRTQVPIGPACDLCESARKTPPKGLTAILEKLRKARQHWTGLFKGVEVCPPYPGVPGNGVETSHEHLGRSFNGVKVRPGHAGAGLNGVKMPPEHAGAGSNGVKMQPGHAGAGFNGVKMGSGHVGRGFESLKMGRQHG